MKKWQGNGRCNHFKQTMSSVYHSTGSDKRRWGHHIHEFALTKTIYYLWHLWRNDKETEDAITLNRQCPAFTILQARISGGEGIIFMNLRWQRQFTIYNRISENCNAIYFTNGLLHSAISIRKLVDYVLRKAICLLLRKRRKLTLPRYLQFLFLYRLSVSQIQPPCSSPGVNPKQLIKGLIDLLSKTRLD